MINIELQELTLSVPENWSDIKLCHYDRFYKMPTSNQHEIANYTAMVCGVDPMVLYNAPASLFSLISDKIAFIFESDGITASNKIKIDNTLFKVVDSDGLSFGEYIDIDSLMVGDGDTILAEVLAIACRPIGEPYDPQNKELTKKRIAMFNDMTCDKILPILSFFFLKSSNCNKNLDQFLKEYQKELYQLLMRHSLTNGGGIRLSQIWQAIKFYASMQSQKRKLKKYLSS